MQGDRLRKLLLNHPLADGRPLFPNAAAIATRLTAQSANTRKERSVISLLSAVFSNIRGFSMDFRAQLIKTVAVTLAERKTPPETARYFIASLDQLIGRHNSELRGAGEDSSLESELAPDEVRAITRFFNDVASKAGLVCCEYRDPPRVYGPAKYGSLLRVAAQAIVQGGSLAMFLPFVAESKHSHAPGIQAFFKELEARLEFGQRQLLKACQEMEPDAQRRAALPRRIALYKLAAAYDTQFATGIQTRTFLAYGQGLGQELTREAWEWVAGADRDYFIKRDPEIVPLLSAQFDPVAFYWRAKGALPKTAPELREAVGMFNELYRTRLPGDIWTVAHD